jgi:hypothetical protein
MSSSSSSSSSSHKNKKRKLDEKEKDEEPVMFQVGIDKYYFTFQACPLCKVPTKCSSTIEDIKRYIDKSTLSAYGQTLEKHAKEIHKNYSEYKEHAQSIFKEKHLPVCFNCWYRGCTLCQICGCPIATHFPNPFGLLLLQQTTFCKPSDTSPTAKCADCVISIM